MSALGSPSTVSVALLVVTSVVGTVGATRFYQQSVDRPDRQNTPLREHNQALQADLESHIASLEDQGDTLQARIDRICAAAEPKPAECP